MCVCECVRARARMCAAATCDTRRNTGDAPDRDAGAPRNLGECPRALQHAFAPAQEAQGAPAHGRVGCLRVHTHSRAAAQVSPRGHAATPQIPRQPRHAPRRPRACRRRGTGKPPAQITLHLRDSRGLRGCPLPFSPAFPLAARRRAPGTQRAVGVLSISKSLARKRNCRLRGRTWRRGKWAAGGSVAGWCRWCCPSTPPVRVPARASAGLGRHAPACEARAVACIFITAALTARRRCAPCCWQTRGGAAGVPGRLCACSPAAAACSDEGRLLARDERVGRRVRGPQR